MSLNDTFIQIRATEFLPAAKNIASYISSTWTGDLSSQSMLFFDENFKVLGCHKYIYTIKNGKSVRVNSSNNAPGTTATKSSTDTKSSYKDSMTHTYPFSTKITSSLILISPLNSSNKAASKNIRSLTTADGFMVSQLALNETQRVLG